MPAKGLCFGSIKPVYNGSGKSLIAPPSLQCVTFLSRFPFAFMRWSSPSLPACEGAFLIFSRVSTADGNFSYYADSEILVLGLVNFFLSWNYTKEGKLARSTHT